MNNYIKYLVVGFLSISMGFEGYSQNNGPLSEPPVTSTDTMMCAPPENCAISNWNFLTFQWFSGNACSVVQDSVCKWNTYNSRYAIPYRDLLFIKDGNFINFDPDFEYDTLQIYQELSSIFTGYDYLLSIRFKTTTAFDPWGTIEHFMVYLTNDDPSKKVPPFSTGRCLLDATNLTGDYLYDLNVPVYQIDTAYRYIIVTCLNTTQLGELWLNNISLCSLSFQVEAGDSVAICPGDSTVLGGAPTAFGGTSPYNYYWSTDKIHQIYIGNPNPKVSPTNSTWYYLFVTDGSRPVQYKTDSILVTLFCSLEIDAGKNVSSCSGKCIVLGGDSVAWGGTPPYSYNWTCNPVGPTGFNPNAEHPIVCPKETTSYFLSVTDSSIPPQLKFDTVIVIIPTGCNWPVIFFPGFERFSSLSMNGCGQVAVSSSRYSGIVTILSGNSTTSFQDQNSGFKRFIANFDKSGKLIWANSLSTNVYSLDSIPYQYSMDGTIISTCGPIGYPLECNALLDDDGNTYVVLNSRDYVKILGNSAPVISVKHHNYFISVLKFDTAGTLINTKIIDDTITNLYPPYYSFDLASDFKIVNDTLYLAFNGPVLIDGSYDMGGSPIFIQMDTDLNLIWHSKDLFEDNMVTMTKFDYGANLFLSIFHVFLRYGTLMNFQFADYSIGGYYNWYNYPEHWNDTYCVNFNHEDRFYSLISSEDYCLGGKSDLWIMRWNGNEFDVLPPIPDFSYKYPSITSTTQYLYHSCPKFDVDSSYVFNIEKYDNGMSQVGSVTVPSLALITSNPDLPFGYYACSSWPDYSMDTTKLDVFNLGNLVLGCAGGPYYPIREIETKGVKLIFSTNEDSISIYPNPFSKFINVEIYSEYFINSQSIELYNVFGKQLKCQAISCDNGEYKLDVTGLSSGIYFIHCRLGNKNFYKKIIKNE